MARFLNRKKDRKLALNLCLPLVRSTISLSKEEETALKREVVSRQGRTNVTGFFLASTDTAHSKAWQIPVADIPLGTLRKLQRGNFTVAVQVLQCLLIIYIAYPIYKVYVALWTSHDKVGWKIRIWISVCLIFSCAIIFLRKSMYV